MESWGVDRATDLAELCRRAMPDERLDVDELLSVCWEDDGVVLGLPDGGGAVAGVRRSVGEAQLAWVKLVAVDPGEQRHGLGTGLLGSFEEWAFDNGATEVLLTGSAPWYLWPAVPADALGMLCLAEARGYEITGSELNMSMVTTFRAPTPDTVSIRRVVEDDEAAAVEAFVERHWPWWVDELCRGIDQGGVHAAWDDGVVLGFVCHSVNRAGWVGPMGTDPDRRSRGLGFALLSAMCEDLMVAGFSTAEVSWVGPVRFYAKAGAQVSRSFRSYRKRRP